MALGEAAGFLRLPTEAVEALALARYLPPIEDGAGPSFAVSDLKGFLARNSEGGANEFLLGPTEQADPRVLIDALDRRSEDMARRALEIFEQAFPEVEKWPERERDRFVDQARKRFEAILAVTAEGAEVDEALVDDLQAVGASAAWSASPLPQLLVVLRISRDLVVQTAVEVAEECGRHWALALALLLNRILPAMDRLTDALAQGYWAAIVGREEESRARYEHLVERSSDGIYEADLDGRILYANPSLAMILGRSVGDLQSVKLEDAFAVVGGKEVLDDLVSEVEGDVSELAFEVLRSDGVRRQLQVVTFPRRHVGLVAGFQGVVRDVTAGLELERAKNEFLALITQDLRSPITTILGLAVTLEAYAEKLSRERLRRMGASVRRQAERISRLADDLHDVSRLESQSLRLTLRTVRLATTVEAALASLDDISGVEVRVPEGATALADARRLEQVVANLVENALAYGDRPVVVEALEEADAMVLSVVDHGRGVPSSLVPNLFSRLQTLTHDRRPGAGLGLFLVKGLVEAMGGRVVYERLAGGSGTAFRVRIPLSRSR